MSGTEVGTAYVAILVTFVLMMTLLLQLSVGTSVSSRRAPQESNECEMYLKEQWWEQKVLPEEKMEG